MNTMTYVNMEIPIFWDGDVGGRDGRPKTVYRIKINDTWMWFVGNEKYDVDGNNFTIFIDSFGSKDKISTEASGHEFRWNFNFCDLELIKFRLKSFFMGPEIKPFYPFKNSKTKCLGLEYAENWILLK